MAETALEKLIPYWSENPRLAAAFVEALEADTARVVGAALLAALAAVPVNEYSSLIICREGDGPWRVMADEPGRVIDTDATRALAALLTRASTPRGTET